MIHRMIGQIDLKRRQEKSYNGVPVAVLKSGIQKYARRGIVDKGLWCVIDLDLFRMVEADPDGVAEYLRRHPRPVSLQADADAQAAIIRKAKAIRTNLVNRLIVMVSEEHSIATYWMPLVVNTLYESWKAQRNQASSRKYLIDIYKYLATQKKIRLISDLKSVYLLPPDYVKPHQRRDLQDIHSDLLGSLGLSDLVEGGKVIPAELADSWPADLHRHLDGKDADLKRIVNGILYHLKNKSDHVFFWLNQLIDRQRDAQGGLRLGRREEPLSVVWGLLLEFAAKREALWGESPKTYPENFSRLGEILRVLKKWYETMTHREKPIYLYHAILLVVRRDEIDWRLPIPVSDTSEDEVDGLYRANLSGKTIDLDDFVFDVHTGKRGMNALARFAREGAFVEDEEQTLRNESYRTIYLALKEKLDIYRERSLGGAAARRSLQ